MPLIGKAGVVGLAFGSSACSLLLQRLVAEIDALGIGAVGALDAAVGLHLRDFAQLLESLGGSLEVGALVELYGVPEVESCLACTCLGVGIDGEDALEAVAAQYGEHLVGRGNARTGSIARTGLAELCLVEDVGHLGAELDEQLTSLSVGWDGDVGLARRRIGGWQVVGTTCQRQCDQCYIEIILLHLSICLLLFFTSLVLGTKCCLVNVAGGNE